MTRGAATAPETLAQGPTGTIHDERRFDPPVVVAPAAAAPVNDNIHPGTTLTPYVDPATLALAQGPTQGPSGTIHPEGTFDPPPTPEVPADATAAPAAPATPAAELAQGPNGTIHPEPTFVTQP